MMLHTKYQGSRPYGFRQEDVSMFFPKICDLQVGTIFGHQGHNLNKLGRGPLGDATYQISRPRTLWFQTRNCFHVLPYISLCKTCDPQGGAILVPGG